MKILEQLDFKMKLLFLGVLLSIVPLLLFELHNWHSFKEQANQLRINYEETISKNLDEINKSVINLAETAHKLINITCSKVLANFSNDIEEHGGLSFSRKEFIDWTCTNQFDKSTVRVRLPKILLGGKWIPKEYEFSKPVDIVDEVAKTTSDTATIFQRMNDQGDMLRVATCVRTNDGKRAVGTYIPVINPDGKPNPVLASVLAGNTYLGRAYVVNRWYVTAYQPISDNTGKITGMIYVGTPEEVANDAVRKSIQEIKISHSGYVFVLGGKGDQRGKYIVSGQGKRDGENLLESLDPRTKDFFRNLIDDSLALKKNELKTYVYFWKNPGETKPREKVVRVSYFEPWDWVVGVGTYKDDLYLKIYQLNDQLNQRFIKTMLLLFLSIIGGVCVWFQVSNYLGEHQNSTRESEQKFRSIFNAVYDAIILYDQKGQIISSNVKALQMFGINTNIDLKSLNINDLVDEKNGFQISQDLTNYVLQGEDRLFEMKALRMNDKTIFDAEIYLSPFSNDGEKVVLACIKNITDRKNTERALRFDEARNRALVEINQHFHKSAKDIADHTMNAAIELTESLSGYVVFMSEDESEMLVQNASTDELFLLLDNKPIVYKTSETGQWGEPIRARKSIILNKCSSSDFDFLDKELVVVRHMGVPVFENNKIVALIGLLNKSFDYTEEDARQVQMLMEGMWNVIQRKRADEARRVSEAKVSFVGKMESIGELAAGIAHEINTPSQFIGDNLAFLKQNWGVISEWINQQSNKSESSSVSEDVQFLLSEIPKSLSDAEEGVKRITTIVRAMREFSHPSDVISMVDINQAIQTTSTVSRNEWKYVADMKLDLDPEMPLIPCYLGDFNQVILNLIVNASHAIQDKNGKEGSEKGLITIRTKYINSCARIIVHDTGCGIPQDIIHKIYDLFFTTKEVGRGTGQGLYMAHQVIVGKHKGRLNCVSKVGEGTTFVIELPATSETSQNNEKK